MDRENEKSVKHNGEVVNIAAGAKGAAVRKRGALDLQEIKAIQTFIFEGMKMREAGLSQIEVGDTPAFLMNIISQVGADHSVLTRIMEHLEAELIERAGQKNTDQP